LLLQQEPERMRNGQSMKAAELPRIVVLTVDPVFEENVRATFAASGQIALHVVNQRLSLAEDVDVDGATVFIADLEDGDESKLQALERIITRPAHRPPTVAVVQNFDSAVVRRLMQMRVADVVTKPVAPLELVRTCARVAKAPAAGEASEAQIFTFLPAVGGAGVTTLAVQTAMLLLESGARGKTATCLVDLDFQHGACADYLDIEPRLNLGEIEPRPERLDRQLLEVMLSYHASGLAVVAAPNRPAEMRSFDPMVVTRLLDLVSSHFEFVVFDMPRTWFSWTDNVLLGSNKVFIVSETTVPSLRQARQLVDAIRERLGDGANPQIIVNRFEQGFFSAGLRRADIERAVGGSLAAFIPNNYGLVREAIDRGVPLNEVKPGNKITAQLKRLIVPQPDKGGAKLAHAVPSRDTNEAFASRPKRVPA
jgi:pilus assembly protein CpaE